MAKLSNCIFEWDADDFNALIRAKRGELVQAGITSLSDHAVKVAITKPNTVGEGLEGQNRQQLSLRLVRLIK